MRKVTSTSASYEVESSSVAPPPSGPQPGQCPLRRIDPDFEPHPWRRADGDAVYGQRIRLEDPRRGAGWGDGLCGHLSAGMVHLETPTEDAPAGCCRLPGHLLVGLGGERRHRRGLRLLPLRFPVALPSLFPRPAPYDTEARLIFSPIEAKPPVPKQNLVKL